MAAWRVLIYIKIILIRDNLLYYKVNDEASIINKFKNYDIQI